MVTTLAGSSLGFSRSTDGPGTSAKFNYPYGITIFVDGTNLYVADKDNHKIRKIVISTGVVTTLSWFNRKVFQDGTGTAASFKQPLWNHH